MISRFLILSFAALIAVGGVGCRSKTSKAAKDLNVPATEMEANFRQRWVDKRSAELVASGVVAEAARQQADKEFFETFTYVRATKAK